MICDAMVGSEKIVYGGARHSVVEETTGANVGVAAVNESNFGDSFGVIQPRGIAGDCRLTTGGFRLVKRRAIHM